MRVGKVEITGGFFLVLAWMNYLDRQFMVPLAMVACVLHELGHYLAIRLFKGEIKEIRLTVVGAEMRIKRPLNYWQEGVVAIAGPSVNLMLALVFSSWEWGLTFAGINLVLALFNLLPLGRLDGGRVFYCTLALLSGPEVARQVGHWLDLVLAGLLLGGGLLLAGAGGNITLLLVAGWFILVVYRQNHHDSPKKACHIPKKQVK